MQKILKNEKGSISLFVLLTALFFLVVVTSVGVSFKNKEAQIDSQYEKIKTSYAKEAEQVYDEKVSRTVTFDANGGEVGVKSKVVKIGDTYGELPIPTREGYTFKGWNGKNMFDEESILMAIPGAIKQNGYYVYNHINAQKTYSAGGKKLPITGFKENTQYTYSIYGYVSDNRQTFYFKYTDESTSYGNFNILENGLKKITSNNNKTIERLSLSYGNYGSSENPLRLAYVSHIQLEEGSTGTEFEPYYVTSSTKVTQDKDHTLTAIWEENTRTVNFDANGGTVNIPSKTVKVGETYGELPTPTREGYTFKGWNGKNLFDEESLLMAISGATYTDNHYVFSFANAYAKYGRNGNSLPITFEERTQYTYSVYGYVSGTNNIGLAIAFSYLEEGTNNSQLKFNQNDETMRILVSEKNKTINRNWMSYGAGNTAYITHIQLEKGENATEFEPYYVTSSTKVTQDKDHILKAIWEENE